MRYIHPNRVRTRGRLPHWELDDAIYFVTFRLADALPQHVLQSLLRERARILVAYSREGAMTGDQRIEFERAFALGLDLELDQGYGECHLAKSAIADLVAGALRYFDGDRYTLHAFAVMPNHVHVMFHLLRGCELARVVHSWKWFTADRANALLKRRGVFWQREYFDRIVRDEKDYSATRAYILNNPSKAGLREWRWVWP